MWWIEGEGEDKGIRGQGMEVYWNAVKGDRSFRPGRGWFRVVRVCESMCVCVVHLQKKRKGASFRGSRGGGGGGDDAVVTFMDSDCV